MRLASLWVGLGLLVGASSCATGSTWWNQRDGNSRRSSYLDVASADAVAPKWVAGVSAHWRYYGRAEPNAPVLAPDGAIVCSEGIDYGRFDEEAGHVRCFEPDGQLRYAWVARDPKSTVTYEFVGTPSVAADGSVVVMCRDEVVNQLFHLDRDGHVLWSWRYPRGPLDTAIVGTHVFFEEERSQPPRTHLVALDLETRIEHRLSFDEANAIGAWCVAPTHELAGDGYLIVLQDLRPPKRVTWARFDPSIGFTPGGDVGPSLAADELFAFPPVVSREGQIVVARRSDDSWGLRVFDSTLKPLLERDFPRGSGPYWQPYKIALGWDRADFALYLVERTTDLTDQHRIIALTGGTYSTTSFPLDRDASTPVVTQSRVHVSDPSGLHTFSLGLQGHVVCASPGTFERRPVQPAVHWDGTVYDLYGYHEDFGADQQIVLRAFAAPVAE